MFNNPLRKYQSGGKATPQQQQQIAQLFEAASKNTGIDVETLMNAANELKDENSMKQYVEAISLAAQGDKTAIDSIKKMFGQQPAMQKLGGKIRDFICKHANGKKIADCGCGGNVEKHQNGRYINEKNKTIASQIYYGRYGAEDDGADPNTAVDYGSQITAYPSKKAYIDTATERVPFTKRNGIGFGLGGVESGRVEDGANVGGGVKGRKYKVSTVYGRGEYEGGEHAKAYPLIMRFASPKDTLYNIEFHTIGSNNPGYAGVRAMYNAAIDADDTVAYGLDAYKELLRQKQERATKQEDGGKVEMHQQKNGGRGKVNYPRQTSAGKKDGYSIANRTWENNIDGSTSSVEIAVGPDGKAVLQRITDRSNMPDRGMLAVRDTVNHIGMVNPLTGIFEEDYDNPGFSTGAHPYFQEIPWNQVKYWSPDYKNGGKTPNWINRKKNK